MESKIGSILLLIGSIFSFLGAIITGLFLIIIFLLRPEEMSEFEIIFRTIFYAFFSVLLFISAIIKLWASSLMKKPESTKKGGIIAIIGGVISFGDMLAFAGGIIAIIQSNENKNLKN